MNTGGGNPDGEILLIDGFSLAFRAFFALPETITRSDGMPTNALYGLSAMTMKVIEDERPSRVIVAWDPPGPTFRDGMYPAYKAGRRETPEGFRAQVPHFRPLMEAFGAVNVEAAGFEADDVIGTLARRASDAGARVTILTGDRDALQLVDHNISVLATGRGVTDTTRYGPAAVEERYGVVPSLMPDLRGMVGDQSDNLPGVPGIGEKTAAELMKRYGTLEAILAHADEQTPKRRENLIIHAATALLCRDLSVIDQSVPLDLDPLDAPLITRDPDRLAAIRAAFEQYGFRTLARRVEQMGGATTDDSAGKDDGSRAGRGVPTMLTKDERPDEGDGSPSGRGIQMALTEDDSASEDDGSRSGWGVQMALTEDGGASVPESRATVVRVQEDTPDAVAIALAGGDQAAIGCAGDTIAVVSGDGVARSVARVARVAGVDAGIAPILSAAPWAAHDAKAILRSARLDGPLPVHDTMIAAYLLNPRRSAYPLDQLAEDEGIHVRAEGGGEDACAAATVAAHVRALAPIQASRIAVEGLEPLFRDIELPLVGVLAAMENVGVAIDVDRLAEIRGRVRAEIATLTERIHDHAGGPFTIDSPKQLAEVLFERLGLPSGRKGKTGYSTDRMVLRSLTDVHEIVPAIIRYRELVKLDSTYLAALPELVDPVDGRVHTTFNQTVAETGRLSSTSPNLQNIPVRTPAGREVRAAFVATAGMVLMSFDYSQVELRILAHCSAEPALRDAFDRGIDVHTATASEVFDVPSESVDATLRARAKAVNFGIIYGISDFGLSEQLGISRADARSYIDTYRARYPKVGAFVDATIARATADGYVTTLLGRRRAIPELTASTRPQRQLGERLAVNTVIQGSAADIIKIAMIRAHAAITQSGTGARLVLQIHDELLVETPPGACDVIRTLVVEAMTGAYPLDPSLAVDVGQGDTWLAAKA